MVGADRCKPSRDGLLQAFKDCGKPVKNGQTHFFTGPTTVTIYYYYYYLFFYNINAPAPRFGYRTDLQDCGPNLRENNKMLQERNHRKEPL